MTSKVAPQTQTDGPNRLLHSVPESRELLGGIGNTTFYDLVKRGRLRLVKIGRRSFLTDDEIKRLVNELTGAA